MCGERNAREWTLVYHDCSHVLAPLIPIAEKDFALVQRRMKEVPHLGR